MKTSIVMKAILALSLLVGAGTATADTLDLSEGTMTTGGRVALTLGDPIGRTGPAINNITAGSWGYVIDLAFGYFIVDNFEIDLTIGSGGNFTNPVSNLNFNVGIGARYNFDLGSMIYPYIGVGTELVWVKDVSPNWRLNVPLSLGILASLNSHVALDLGVTAGLGWGLSSGSTSTPRLYGQLGYLGVRAFF